MKAVMGDTAKHADTPVAEVAPTPGASSGDREGGRASWEEPHLPFSERFRKHWRQTLVHLWGPIGSLVFHVVAIGVLVTFATSNNSTEIVSEPVVLEARAQPELEKAPEPEKTKPPEPVEQQVETPQENNIGFSTVESAEIGGSGTQETGIGLGTGDPNLPDKGFEIATSVKSRLVLKGLHAGRTAGGRKGAMGKYGGGVGGAMTEGAVLRALRWLKKFQEPDGSWTPHSGGPAPKPGGELYAGNPEAFTGLALLTFLGHGETPSSVEFGETVRKAIEWLIAHQKSDGTWNNPSGDLGYSHAIATYAMCEANAIVGNPQVKESAARGVDYILAKQASNGGWNYLTGDPQKRQDVSVTSWCFQALKAARMSGLDSTRVDAALKKGISCYTTVLFNSAGGYFNYSDTGGGEALAGLTSTAVLSLELAGAANCAEAKAGLNWLVKNASCDWTKPWGRSPLYYWYYTTQVMFHAGGAPWKNWNNQFAAQLVRNQVVVKNAIQDPNGQQVDIGYWMPVPKPAEPEYCQALVYNTTLCALQLEVYYRYLPTYQHVDNTPPEAAAGPKDDEVRVIIK